MAWLLYLLTQQSIRPHLVPFKTSLTKPHAHYLWLVVFSPLRAPHSFFVSWMLYYDHGNSLYNMAYVRAAELKHHFLKRHQKNYALSLVLPVMMLAGEEPLIPVWNGKQKHANMPRKRPYYHHDWQLCKLCCSGSPGVFYFTVARHRTWLCEVSMKSTHCHLGNVGQLLISLSHLDTSILHGNGLSLFPCKTHLILTVPK